MALSGTQADTEPVRGDFAEAVLGGLGARAKSIPCRFLYDARGSELFEEITRLEEYYPTRTEVGLLEKHGPEISELAGPGSAVVEFGSGSSRKTHVLLDHLHDPAAYVPIDIDAEALSEAAARLERSFPDLPLHPVHADFSQGIVLPGEIASAPKLGFFPGSTIGNFELDDAVDFLVDAGDLLGEDGELLIGADLRKDLDVLLPAYDDAGGITAAFVLNLVHRINRELGGDLDVRQFSHEAVYNDAAGRIEIYIVSRADQVVGIMGRKFPLAEGERIHVENSHKYTLPQFEAMAHAAGWRLAQVWTDERDYFSLQYLSRGNGSG